MKTRAWEPSLLDVVEGNSRDNVKSAGKTPGVLFAIRRLPRVEEFRSHPT